MDDEPKVLEETLKGLKSESTEEGCSADPLGEDGRSGCQGRAEGNLLYFLLKYLGGYLAGYLLLSLAMLGLNRLILDSVWPVDVIAFAFLLFFPYAIVVVVVGLVSTRKNRKLRPGYHKKIESFLRRNRVLAFGLVAILLAASSATLLLPECEHDGLRLATCTEPITCAKCGMTEGEPLGHDWEEATCVQPETCARCGETRGQATGEHEWLGATYTEPKTCAVCGLTEGAPLSEADYSAIPDDLMNDAFKTCLSYFGVDFREIGLSAGDAVDTGSGTYVFYLDGLEFAGKECEGGYMRPRLVYDTDVVDSGFGRPSKIFLQFSVAQKSNGHKETMRVVSAIENALGIEIDVENDYTSSSKRAVGRYCTVEIPGTGLEMSVSNTQGTVKVEIVPIER